MNNQEKINSWGKILAENGISQRRLSKQADIYPDAISMYLRGERMPSAISIDKIEAALKEILKEIKEGSDGPVND